MELTEIEAGYDMVDSHQDDRGGMCEWLKQAVLKTFHDLLASIFLTTYSRGKVLPNGVDTLTRW